MAGNRFGIYAAQLNGSTLVGIRRQSFSANNTIDQEGHDGRTTPIETTVLAHKPEGRLSTFDLDSIFTSFGAGYLGLTGLTLYYRKRANKAEYASGSSHFKASATTGVAVLQPIRAQHEQVVEAEIMAYLCSSDGFTPPWTVSTSQAVAGTLAACNRYTLGPLVFTPSGGSATPIRVQSWEFDPGINVQADSDDGKAYCDSVSVTEGKPTVTAQTFDFDKISTVPLIGAAGSLDLYLWRLTNGGVRSAVGDSHHKRIRLFSVLATADDGSGDHGPGHATANLRFTAVDDLSNGVFSLTSGVTLTGLFG
jgi:hypothetical protein